MKITAEPKITVDQRVLYLGLAAFLFLVSFSTTQFGVCTGISQCEPLLGFFRVLVMLSSFAGAILAVLFGVVRVQD